LVPLGLSFILLMFLASSLTPQWPTRMAELSQRLAGMALDSYIVSFCVGAPIALVLSRLERLTTLNILISASASGFLLGIAFGLLVDWPRADAWSGVLGALVGLIVSGSFVIICGGKFGGLALTWRHAGPLIVLAEAAWIGWLGWQTVELRRFEERLSETATGMSQEEVVARLGEPNGDAMACSYYSSRQAAAPPRFHTRDRLAAARSFSSMLNAGSSAQSSRAGRAEVHRYSLLSQSGSVARSPRR
jgi:hypothetical protein